MAVGASLIDKAAAVLRAAGEDAILPRFRALGAGEVEEKTPGELVTIADREAEASIACGLAALVPGSRVVGEEACAANPRLIGTVGEGLVWLVDPLDGTANFVAGEPDFATMAALLRDGEAIAAVIFAPLSGRVFAAERGAGARVDGERHRTDPALRPGRALRHVVGRFMPAETAARVQAQLSALPPPVPTVRAASVEYPLIASGERHAAFYWRTLPWDHAAGVLFLNEAGGRAARPGGEPWRAGRPGHGLIAAHNPAIWAELDRLLKG